MNQKSKIGRFIEHKRKAKKEGKKQMLSRPTLNVALIFKESGFQIILTKLLQHAYFRFRIFNPIMLSGSRLFNLTIL